MTNSVNSDPSNTPVDTTSVDPSKRSKGTDADDTQNPAERDEAIREFDHHAEQDGPDSLDRSEELEGASTPQPSTPDPEDVTAGDKDDKQTTRSE